MIVLLGIILVLRVDCRSFIQGYPRVHPGYIIRSDSIGKIKEEYDAYIDLKDNEDDSNEYDILSEEERFISNGHQFGTDRDRELIQTYILVKTLRQRNKRYSSYLTLCHFKICNMGKKRRTRFVHGMESSRENRI
ncbi:uncharacterized protein LOC123672064 [Harmonia axyridis]|uniref:uncharacterized protein LOC123672064 n=1 Tax=Harmonia axyridis TaxID=115357 RepID=UPI001E27872F|nr:uncharacterized protein LOC123672064 [Harmonia axyridis]